MKESPEQHILRRNRLLGRGVRQYYEFPFMPIRAEGVRVWDRDGKEYLDAYNNVPHVGHCNPQIVDVLESQARQLNTNTRYLYDSVLDYAEQLTSILPEGLDVCIFTSSGSEANDLAWRIAANWTGATGAIGVEHSYHGNTTILSAINGQSALGGRAETPWVESILPPDPATFRRALRVELSSLTYAEEMRRAAAALEARGHRPAAFFADSAFCASGVLFPETGLLNEAVEVLRRAGGVWVADEIQSGLGRIGDHMWGFESIGGVPDLVTLGKPMGNGHPIGVVAGRRDMIEAFYSKNSYFNTFGGNTVSAAVGAAVVRTVLDQGLDQNAKRVGAILLDRLRRLASKYPFLGDVRGRGLLIGMDVVSNRQAGEPDGDMARRLINDLCMNGLLVGLTGPNKKNRNVIKIRPPLVFSEADADILVETFDRTLARI